MEEEDPPPPHRPSKEGSELLGFHRLVSPRRRTLVGVPEPNFPQLPVSNYPPDFFVEQQKELKQVIASGDRGALQKLLDDKNFLEALNHPLQTPALQTLVHFAASDSQAEMLLVLGLCGADFNKQDAYGWTPIHCIALRCAHQAGSELDTTPRRDLEIQNDRTLGGMKSLEILLKREGIKIDMNVGNNEKTTPFHYIVSYMKPKGNEQNGLYSKILGLCIQRGADINFQNELGESPLHYAARHENLEAVCFLLQNGAKTDLITT